MRVRQGLGSRVVVRGLGFVVLGMEMTWFHSLVFVGLAGVERFSLSNRACTISLLSR